MLPPSMIKFLQSRMRCSCRIDIVGIVFLLGLLRANAALLAYEGFDYPASSTIGLQTGGSLWTNAWAGGATGNFLGTNAAVSLAYTDANGQALVTSGGSLIVGNPSGPSATTATPNRTLNQSLSGGTGTSAGSGRTVWLSFLYQRLNLAAGGAPYFRQANLGLFEGGSERLAVGGPNTSATVSNVFSVWGSGVTHSGAMPFQSPGNPLLVGATSFILIKVVTDGSAAIDPAYVWFNWTNLAVEPDIVTADIVDNELNLSGVNTLRFQAGNQNASGTNAAFQVDELRVGTTFADVTPYAMGAAAPAIAVNPQDVTATASELASFTVNATGAAPLSYQWYFNTNTLLANATNSTFSINSVGPGDAGGYSVVVTNDFGAVTSAVAILTVLAPVPAAITASPLPFTNVVGFNATFSATATGTPPLRYQWFFNDTTLLAGQTNATLIFPIASTNDAGGYQVVVTNNYGAATSSVAMLSVVPGSPAFLPAFPGADGAAKYITGGRGGIVYRVTKLDRNLNHNEPGTLRYGLTDGNFPPGVPRTILFEVAGTFWLGRFGAENGHQHGWDSSSRYNFSANTTIAGQTAPGPVIIAGGVTKIGGTNTIVRNVTFAPSYGLRGFAEPPAQPTPGDFPDSFVFDALDISGQNIMLDHLTAIYATDETISCNELAANLTIQFCTIAQGENYPQADAESPGVYTGHALGSLLQAGSNARISVINNLYAHLKGRLPRVGSEIGSGAFNDFRNNVFYNWLGTAGSGANGQPSYNNFINNFYLAGQGGEDVSGPNIVNAAGGTGIFNGANAAFTRAFVNGNLKDLNKDADPNDTISADGDFISIAAQPAAYDVEIGVTLSARAALTNALRHAGSRWWERDYDIVLGNSNAINTVDERLVQETITGTGKIVAWADDPFNSSPDEGTEWRSLLAWRADPITFTAPFNRPANWDTDGDGLPDDWEIAHGLNPQAANNNSDFDRDGYTDLEEYLNELAAWPAPGIIEFTGETNNRYAEIFNWRVTGVNVSIAGRGNLPTTSHWQPSRYDEVLISNRTVTVDAVGQHAGTLELTHGGALELTSGWLNVARDLNNGSDGRLRVDSGATLRVTNNLVNHGTLILSGGATLAVQGAFTNFGTLDLLTWEGTLPPGFVNAGTVIRREDLVLTAYGVSGANFTATIPGFPNHAYQFQVAESLANEAWENLGAPISGTGGPIQLLHVGGGNGAQRFYRVLVDP